MNPATPASISLLRLLVVLAAAGAGVYLLIRTPRLLFKDPVAKGQARCAKDDTYYYKDPQNHPYDC